MVAFPDFTLPFSLYTDASCSAIGAVLAQRHGHQKKVFAYASHVLTKAEGNGQRLIENHGLLCGQSDIFATTSTISLLLLSQTTNLFWVSEKYPLTMTELAVVLAGLLN